MFLALEGLKRKPEAKLKSHLRETNTIPPFTSAQIHPLLSIQMSLNPNTDAALIYSLIHVSICAGGSKQTTQRWRTRSGCQALIVSHSDKHNLPSSPFALPRVPGGDLLRSVPCVTVWHQKIISWIPCARENSIKVYFLYVPRIIKNIRGHLPDLIRKNEKFWHFLVCHTVTLTF